MNIVGARTTFSLPAATHTAIGALRAVPRLQDKIPKDSHVFKWLAFHPAGTYPRHRLVHRAPYSGRGFSIMIGANNSAWRRLWARVMRNIYWHHGQEDNLYNVQAAWGTPQIDNDSRAQYASRFILLARSRFAVRP